jgi:hypothetical protein
MQRGSFAAMTKNTATLFFILVSATAATAQDSLPAQMTACLQITGMLQRLACYDRVAHGISPAPAPRGNPVQRPVASAAAPAAGVVPPAVIAPAAGLGSERLPSAAPANRAPQQLLAGVASVSYDPRGHFTMTLDNGQIWRQLAGDTSVLTGSRISTVRITRGALGSYDLNVVGRNATYRVTRIQ